MKISMEIKDDKFIYSYSIGENENHSHSMNLSSANLVLFCDALKYASETINRKMKDDNEQMKIDMLVKAKLEEKR